jgi:hypothetical protein
MLPTRKRKNSTSRAPEIYDTVWNRAIHASEHASIDELMEAQVHLSSERSAGLLIKE